MSAVAVDFIEFLLCVAFWGSLLFGLAKSGGKR